MATTLQVHSCMHRALISILLLGSMLLASSEEPSPPPSYRFDLIHVDGNGSFTREEPIHRASSRTFLRAATLSATDSTASSTMASSTVVGAEYSQNEYLMMLRIGTPPKPFVAIADTGSDVTWTKETKLCNKATSSSFKNKTCSQSDSGCSECINKQCMFKKIYGSQKKTATGFMGSDVLTLSDEKKVDIEISCATNCDDGNCDKMLPSAANGLVGLNRAPNSLLAKLNVTKFSYCLSSPHPKPELRSQIWFGDRLRLVGEEVQTTPLVEFEKIKPKINSTSVQANRYYVELHGISIGDKHQDLSEGFDLRSENGKGIMFIDSGASYSHLQNDAFEVLKKLLGENGLTESSKKETFSCFEGAHSQPEMVLHLNGTKMHLPWDSYMFKEDNLSCLAIKKAKKGIPVLGNFQQQNILMLYDLGMNKLSFVQVKDCGIKL